MNLRKDHKRNTERKRTSRSFFLSFPNPSCDNCLCEHGSQRGRSQTKTRESSRSMESCTENNVKVNSREKRFPSDGRRRESMRRFEIPIPGTEVEQSTVRRGFKVVRPAERKIETSRISADSKLSFHLNIYAYIHNVLLVLFRRNPSADRVGKFFADCV